MNRNAKQGMTLVEVLITVSIIGMLAAVLIPAVIVVQRGKQNAECARKLRVAAEAFELYAAETGAFPPDQNCPGDTTVPDMEAYYFPYFKIDWWGDATELGGRWDWDVGYHGFAQSVSIWCPTVSAEQLLELDRMVDGGDGDLATGAFRKVGSQYHYIVRN